MNVIKDIKDLKRLTLKGVTIEPPQEPVIDTTPIEKIEAIQGVLNLSASPISHTRRELSIRKDTTSLLALAKRSGFTDKKELSLFLQYKAKISPERAEEIVELINKVI